MLIPNGTKVKVKKVVSEVREFLGKDGITKVKRQVFNCTALDADGDIIKITSFDPAFPLPKDGSDWVLPFVKKLDCYDGLVQNLFV